MKKLLAILLATVIALALTVPAFAADGWNPISWLKSLWEDVKAWVRRIFFPPMLEKPVIYLYPEQPMEVSVTLRLHGARFTETIPDYNEGWCVLAQPDGTLTNLADGKTYPYLFWEALPDTPLPLPQEGFIVAREDLAGFLNEKLAYLGLNDAEAGEFAAFWLPRLLRNEYTLIHFAGKEYDERFPLQVSPAPNSLLRVFMVARAAAGNERIAPQELVPFERKGFAVIEWGGTILRRYPAT